MVATVRPVPVGFDESFVLKGANFLSKFRTLPRCFKRVNKGRWVVEWCRMGRQVHPISDLCQAIVARWCMSTFPGVSKQICLFYWRGARHLAWRRCMAAPDGAAIGGSRPRAKRRLHTCRAGPTASCACPGCDARARRANGAPTRAPSCGPKEPRNGHSRGPQASRHV